MVPVLVTLLPYALCRVTSWALVPATAPRAVRRCRR